MGVSKLINKPESIISNGMELSGRIFTLMNELANNQKEQVDWLKNTVGKTVSLAAHAVKEKVRSKK